MNPKLRKWHVRLGLLIALPLAVILCTALGLGTLRALHLIARAKGPFVEVKAALTSVLAHHRSTELSGISFPPSAELPVRVELRSHGEDWVNLKTGAILKDGPASDQFMEWLYRIHRGKILGLTGQIAFSAVAAIMLVLLTSGWVIRTKRSRPSRHRKFGLLVGWLFILVMVPGAILNFGGLLAQKYDPVPLVSEAPAQADVRLVPALVSALHAYPDSPLVSIHLPRRAGEPLQFFFEDSSRVYIDPSNSQVLKTASWRSHWTRSLFALHTGRFLGTAQPLWILIVAGPALVLLLTGLLLAKKRI